MATQHDTTETGKSMAEAYLFTYAPIGNTKSAEFTYYDHLTFYFKQWHRCMSEFEINPEFNSNGNLHYHGYFIIKDKVKWYKNVLPKMKYNGLVKIDKVTKSLVDALVYCRKDNHFMVKIIKKYPVPYTHHSTLMLERPDSKQDTIMTFLDGLTRAKIAKEQYIILPQDENIHELDDGLT